jgi:hypothetical protein
MGETGLAVVPTIPGQKAPRTDINDGLELARSWANT